MQKTFSFIEKNIPNVSRETLAKLTQYHALLLKWQKAINLVSPSTIKEADTRHFLDSAQMVLHLPQEPFKLIDLGSGAGFPSVVIAMLRPDLDVHMVESDKRKCIFMQTVALETKTPLTVHNSRIENLGIKADIVTARALASLESLFDYAHKCEPKSYIFLKGEKCQEEIEQAKKNWSFDADVQKSVVENNSFIVKITNLVKNT